MGLRILSFAGLSLVGFFAAFPTSTNYSLKNYDVGGSGGSSSSTNFNLNANVGTQSGASSSSTNYSLKPGETPTQHAFVPAAPTLTNPGNNEYSRLKLVINPGNNASDTKFAIAISSDNFATTNYVKADTSFGTSFALTDYQTYSSWGGASGFYITGLTPSTTYKVKVKAMKGDFTETGYGPTTSGVATVQPTVTFGVATSPPAGPPYNATFTSLNAGTVYNANADAALNLTTNALGGGLIYVSDSNTGLTSASAGYTIASATADLSSAGVGYGGIITATSQSSGGPMSSVAPFNGVSNSVGGFTTTLQPLATTTGPVAGGTVTLQFKAKTDAVVPSATDYSDVLTFVAAMSF